MDEEEKQKIIERLKAALTASRPRGWAAVDEEDFSLATRTESEKSKPEDNNDKDGRQSRVESERRNTPD